MIHARQVHPVARRHMAGLSLIEMMIALVMALIVAAGIITVFASTSSSNKVQQQMAALQEEGRFAIHSLRDDLANANGTYCSNSGGNASGTSSGLYLDALRSPTVYATSAIPFNDDTVLLPTPTQAYSLPSSMFLRGYDCTTTGCTPLDPNSKVPAIPAAGKAVGNRVVGSDVLTIRYLKPGSGWAIVKSGSAAGSTMNTTTVPATITLNPLAGEPAATTFTGSLAMLADCSNAQVFAVANGGGTLTLTGANYAQPLDISQGAAPRVYDFSNDFQTVTYFLQVVCVDGAATCPGGPTTGELMRRVNGNPQPLVRGVERLDFRYGIIDSNGNTQYLTAAQVDSGTNCPPDVPIPGGMPSAGCLWRAVQSIEVHILMDGQTPLYTLTPNEMQYLYTPDGNTLNPPSAHTIKPNADQGFPQQLIRREFTTLVALRNFNP
ncbi:MAG: hypothetical protein OJF55_001377 [Rhodanobacteraceae bacterium]|jgi:type IV pilus assembly protein PilW|nr:MAG: hypothetical protein OJF55_001377 [Rhodanobacteraceae bacterium]